MAWVIDPAHTLIEFTVKHMMITTVRGRFNKFSGTLNLDEAHPERSSVEGSVEVASIDTRDPDRDAHLRSPDFFDVEKYPTMRFRSKRIEPAGRDRFKVVGDLTVKDVTREVVFDVTNEGRARDPWGNQRWGFSAQMVLNQIKVEVEVETVQQEAVPATEEQPEVEAIAA
jgi:polyisoprenoid-binding protein YceI